MPPPMLFDMTKATLTSVATLTGLIVGAAALPGTAAQAADTRTITNTELNFSVTLPASCRIEEGPGTIEAVCSPDLDPSKSLVASAASALLLELDYERVPAAVKAVYGEVEFRQELPEAVCGESEPTKVGIADFKRTDDGDRVIWTAMVTCPDIKFLGLSERTANVRYITTPAFRYRLMARTPSIDLPATQATRDAFLSSFTINGSKAP
jgi:hypothetical protein